MKKCSKFKYFMFVFICFFSLFVKNVWGANANIGFSGANSVYQNKEITVTMYIDNITGAEGGIGSIGGILSYDTSKLQLINKSNHLPFSYNDANNKFAWVYSGVGITSRSNLITFTFRALKPGTTTISISNPNISDTVPNRLSSSVLSKTININEPPSTNNNLASLSVSPGSIQFNANTTNYNVSVEENVTSIQINASAADKNARVDGVGTKSLNYGTNTFKVVVTAPSGDAKTYTINVTRKDSRSPDNNLSSLSVKNGTLNPGFNPNTTTYSVTVPYEVTTLEVNAVASSSKAKISISNNQNLVAEETRQVVVTVTAENGSRKEYYINVTRGKDPNKKLSTVKNLSSLTVDKGMLSPAFQKEQLEYVVYLPYEIKELKINYTLEDTKYGRTEEDFPANLSVGKNLYKIRVYAEDNSYQEYKINVMRGENLSKENLSDNAYLKEIQIENGKLKEKFEKEKLTYTYHGKNIKITAIPEDENATFKIIEQEGNIYVIVTSSSGTNLVYELKEQKFNFLLIILPVIFLIFGMGIGYVFPKVWKKKEKEPSHKEKQKILKLKK